MEYFVIGDEDTVLGFLWERLLPNSRAAATADAFALPTPGMSIISSGVAAGAVSRASSRSFAISSTGRRMLPDPIMSINSSLSVNAPIPSLSSFSRGLLPFSASLSVLYPHSIE